MALLCTRQNQRCAWPFKKIYLNTLFTAIHTTALSILLYSEQQSHFLRTVCQKKKWNVSLLSRFERISLVPFVILPPFCPLEFLYSSIFCSLSLVSSPLPSIHITLFCSCYFVACFFCLGSLRTILTRGSFKSWSSQIFNNQHVSKLLVYSWSWDWMTFFQ